MGNPGKGTRYNKLRQGGVPILYRLGKYKMEHMNAVAPTVKKYHQIKDSLDYIVEEKLKGIRAYVHFDLTGNIVQSRGGFDISHRFPHIRDCIIPDLTGTTFDGELFQPGVPDEVIAGWGNVNTKYIDPSVTKDVKLYTFDIVEISLIPFIFNSQLQRKLTLLRIFDQCSLLLDPICIHHTWKQNTPGLVGTWFKEVLAKGGEGLMLKHKQALYKPGTRLSNIWFKVKGTQDFDVVITGFEMAESMSIKKGDSVPTPTKFAGLIGAFKYGMYVNGYLVDLGTCSGMTDSDRISMTQNPNLWLNTVVEIIGVEQLTSGAIENPRFIRPRSDKLPEQCIWNKEV